MKSVKLSQFIPGVVLAPIKLNSLQPGSSILVMCRQPPITEGGLNLINSLGIPLGRACAAQLSVNQQTNCKLDFAFSCGAVEVCRWQIKDSSRSSECDLFDLKIDKNCDCGDGGAQWA